MHIETSINSVKVTFDLQRRNISATDDAKNGAKSGAKSGAKKITARQEKILDLIRKDPGINLDSIAESIGVSPRTLDREILKMAHLIKRVGPKKGGHWEIL